MTKFLLSAMLFTSAAASSLEKEPIVIGSKTFSESIILAEMAAILLEQKYGRRVVRKTNLGGTKVVFDALVAGDIDLYPDYTGTGYVMILKREGERNPEKVYDIVAKEFEERFGVVWSRPLGFNNTYAMAVRKGDPRFENVESISEISDKANLLSFTAPHEFMERPDGYLPFKNLYDLNFDSRNVKSLDSGLMYSAIRDGQTDIIMSYSTDGRIGAYNLKILEDDKNFFPPYFAAFLSSKKSLKKHPSLKNIFKDLENMVTEEEMIEMNDLVDRSQREPREVARNWLIDQGLIQGDKSQATRAKSFWAYALSKKRYLYKIVIEHLYLSFGALFLALMFSLPMGVALTRNPRLSRVVFPAINTVQTIPSLALLGFLIPIMGIGYAPAVLALFLYSLLPLVRNTYAGIEAVDKDYIEASRGIGLTEWQILWRVEVPLALPVILAGVRTASVIVIGTATLAALVGAGGLGDPIFRGVSTVNGNLILLGAIPSAILAVLVDKALGLAENKMVSKGLRL